MYNVLVTLPLSEEQRDAMRAVVPEWSMTFSSHGRVDAAAVAQAEVIIGNIPIDLVPHARRLLWLQLYSSGATGYTRKIDDDTVLTCATGSYGTAVAEHMLALLLSLSKQIPAYCEAQSNGTWIRPIESTLVHGKRVLIVGTGDIGSTFARYMVAMGAQTVGVKRTLVDQLSGFSEIHTIDELDTVLPSADIVAISLPGTEQTRHLFDRRRLAMMKSDAIVLNVGRGNVINSMDLDATLREGHLAAVGLDVFEEEPLPAEHPLWTAPRLLITPHAAGGLLVGETRKKVFALCMENLRRFCDGEPLVNLVDRKTGYKGN